MDTFLIKDSTSPIYGVEDDILINKEEGCLSYGFEIKFAHNFNFEEEISNKIMTVLGKNYLIHEQIILFNTCDSRKKRTSFIFISKVSDSHSMSKTSNSFLTMNKECDNKTSIYNFSNSEINDFHKKKCLVTEILTRNNYLNAIPLSGKEYLDSYTPIFQTLSLKSEIMPDINLKEKKLYVGEKRLRFYKLNEDSMINDNDNNSIKTDFILNRYYYLPNNKSLLNGKTKFIFSLFNKIFNFIEPKNQEERFIYTYSNLCSINENMENAEENSLKLKEKIHNLINLYFACCGGNSIGLPISFYEKLQNEKTQNIDKITQNTNGNIEHKLVGISLNSI